MTSAAFRIFGLTGLATAAVVVAVLAARSGQQPAVVLLLAPAGAASLVLSAYARQVVTGRDRLVLIEDAAVAGGVLIALCALLGQPVRPWADLVAVGLAVFGGIGRLGCQAAGCCHGRPTGFGLSYRRPAPAGPPLGVPLIPVPLIESAGLLALAALLIRTGGGLGGVMLGYGLLRTGTELARGDRSTRRSSLVARTEAAALGAGGLLVLLL